MLRHHVNSHVIMLTSLEFCQSTLLVLKKKQLSYWHNAKCNELLISKSKPNRQSETHSNLDRKNMQFTNFTLDFKTMERLRMTSELKWRMTSSTIFRKGSYVIHSTLSPLESSRASVIRRTFNSRCEFLRLIRYKIQIKPNNASRSWKQWKRGRL
jgi:hypothetical protein